MPDRIVNSHAEARMRREAERQRADEALRASKSSQRNPRRQVESAFTDPRARGSIARWIRSNLEQIP